MSATATLATAAATAEAAPAAASMEALPQTQIESVAAVGVNPHLPTEATALLSSDDARVIEDVRAMLATDAPAPAPAAEPVSPASSGKPASPARKRAERPPAPAGLRHATQISMTSPITGECVVATMKRPSSATTALGTNAGSTIRTLIDYKSCHVEVVPAVDLTNTPAINEFTAFVRACGAQARALAPEKGFYVDYRAPRLSAAADATHRFYFASQPEAEQVRAQAAEWLAACCPLYAPPMPAATLEDALVAAGIPPVGECERDDHPHALTWAPATAARIGKLLQEIIKAFAATVLAIPAPALRPLQHRLHACYNPDAEPRAILPEAKHVAARDASPAAACEAGSGSSASPAPAPSPAPAGEGCSDSDGERPAKRAKPTEDPEDPIEEDAPAPAPAAPASPAAADPIEDDEEQTPPAAPAAGAAKGTRLRLKRGGKMEEHVVALNDGACEKVSAQMAGKIARAAAGARTHRPIGITSVQ